MSEGKAQFDFYEHPLGEERGYAKALAARFPGAIEFESGCGHIAYDLMARMPSIPEMEDAKSAFCHVVAEAISPLSACLFAKSVGLRIIASPHSLSPPEAIAGIGTYTVFDLQGDVMRHCMLPPPDREAYESSFRIEGGVTVLAEPLNLAGHQFRDSTSTQVHNVTTDAVWNWTERMIHAWYDRVGKTFVPERLRLRATGLAGQVLGVVESAAVEAIAASVSVASTLVHGHKPETPHITSAFIHEAGYAETAAHPKSKEPAPSDAHQHKQHPHAPKPQPDI